MATSRCGIRFRSSNISPRNSRRAKLWPEDRARRAHARSISAEMHSGFMALRNECGMNLHRPVGAVALSEDARANVARIQEIWADCHRRYGKEGPFLFGAFGGADAMFAPVVHRFRTYAIEVIGRCAALFRCDDGAAGVPGMDPRRPCRDARHRAVRDGLKRGGAGARPGEAVPGRGHLGRAVTKLPGRAGLNSRHADFREPPKRRFIALKNLQNSRVCHVLMLLAFAAAGVLGCRRVLKSAEASGTVSAAGVLA